MYSEETKSSGLAKQIAIHSKVYLDTCSLMEDSFPQFMDNLDNSRDYWKEFTEIIVLGECLDELKKHLKSEEVHKRIGAKRAKKILKHDKWHHKIIKIEKPAHKDAFADRAIYAKVSDLRISEKILVITQDKKLAIDIKGLNNLESQKGRFINVYHLDKDGNLVSDFKFKDFERKSSAENARKKKNEPKKQTAEIIKSPAKTKKITSKNDTNVSETNLLANLSNPNYPAKKKLEDIDKQLSALKALDPEKKKKLNLKLPEEKLLEERKKIQDLENREKIIQQTATEPATLKQETAKLPNQALVKLGRQNGWMFRDPTVPFMKGIHGPYDLTGEDLAYAESCLESMSTGEKKDIFLKEIIISAEKRNAEYIVSFVEKPVEVKKQKKAPPKVKDKKPKTEQQPSKKEQKNPATNKQDKPSVSKPKETKKIKEPSKENPVKHSAGFAEAAKYDQILNANINNPNYPLENAEKDIADQMYRVKHLKPGESKELLLGLKALETKRLEIINKKKH